jgi:pimeloyl-ACP methyl ester carboxylesterase
MFLVKFLAKIFKWIFIALLCLFILASVIPYFFSNKANDKLTEKPFDNSFFVNINQTKFHYRFWDATSGKAKNFVVLIHGFSGSTFSYRYTADFLSKNNCFVVAVDMPGFGYSDKSDSANYSDTTRLQAIKRITQKINPVTKWDIVGHSMGAGIAASYANTYPENVNKLVCIDGLPNINLQGNAFTSFLLKYPPIKRWAEIIGKNNLFTPEKFKELITKAYSQEPDYTAIQGYLKPFLENRSASAVIDYASTKPTLKNNNTFSQNNTFIIWGQNDELIPLVAGLNYYKENPQITFKIIEQSGHCPMETHYSETNKSILDFIIGIENETNK